MLRGVCQYAPTIIFGELVTRTVAFKVGLLGLGTVGTGTVQLLLDAAGRNPLLQELEIYRVGVRSLDKSSLLTKQLLLVMAMKSLRLLMRQEFTFC